MNKKIICLLLCSLLTVSLTGCDSHITINGKEIFSFNSDEKEEEKEQEQQQTYERNYTDEQVINAVKDGTYTLTLTDTGEQHVFSFEEVLNKMYKDPLYVVSFSYGTGMYRVMITDNGTGEYVTVEINETMLQIVQVCSDNVIYKDESAKNKFLDIVYNMFLNGELTDDKEQATNDIATEEQKKTDNNTKDQEGGMTFESQAPYGRCPMCNAANASDKGYQGDYCDDCFTKIKQEEYEEKHKYGDCIDCGVYLTKNQSELYGGRCPDCYARYYGDNDTHMGSCDRCGDRVDLDHTNEGWGYQHLCSACTGELQELESLGDSNPYAG